MTDISRYLDFVLTLFFAFGAAFEVPVVTVLLVWTGMTTQAALREKRPYVIVGAFVVGMLLTPPDVISQTLLAVPVWLLFELGVYFSGWFIRQKSGTEPVAQEGASDYQPMTDAEMDAELDRLEKED
jgi:sec-independent protein translocase protein TatC